MPSLAAPLRANVLGVGINATNLQEAVLLSDRLLRTGHKGYVCLTGVHGVMESQRDSTLRDILHGAALCLPDGMPTVWMGRAQGHRHMGRVYGPDYMLAMCRMSVVSGYSHFLYGGNPGVAAQLKARLEKLVPGIRIVGCYTPPYRPLNGEEEEELRNLVDVSRPDILWVGLSTPKQELFMGEYIGKLQVGIMAGVGAAFDIHAGLRADAPGWMKTWGWQWFHRLCQEPRRLWRRYLCNNPAFVWHAARQLLGLQQFGLE